MQDMKKLKNSDKVETVQEFLNIHKSTIGNTDTFYDPKSIAYGVADFLAMDFTSEDKPMDALESLILEYAKGHQKDVTIQRKDEEIRHLKKIDFSKTTNSDLVDEALQPIRGVMAILSNTALSPHSGADQFQSQSYWVLYSTCNGVLEKFDEIKTEIDYMEDVIRGDA